MSAPVRLIEGLEVALPCIVDWTIPKLSAIIEDHYASRFHNPCHFSDSFLSWTIWQLVEEVSGGHLCKSQ